MSAEVLNERFKAPFWKAASGRLQSTGRYEIPLRWRRSGPITRTLTPSPGIGGATGRKSLILCTHCCQYSVDLRHRLPEPHTPIIVDRDAGPSRCRYPASGRRAIRARVAGDARHVATAS